ncbi:MAG: ribose-phosphate pyrophosphokinase [Planctomycetaceae bacterium]|jgi:ribose-phosphate pyrophosphokinase|nr:ribose-phosphate pyrophosphokinase [Planctomycetaceae bacterium]
MNELMVFSGRSNPELAVKICNYLKIEQGKILVDQFPDGETRCKIEEDVRGEDVFIIQPTCTNVNQYLMELLIMIDSFKRASAKRITVVMPYYGYARQDRKDEGRVPITAKLVANLITRAGADRVLTMDLHAAQIQGFFDIPVDHLTAAPVLDTFFRNLGYSSDEVLVVSPDEGSIKRAAEHVGTIGGSLAIIDKRRYGNRVEQANLIGGPIDGKVCFILDDLISTASSICGAARLVHHLGARKIYIGATHGVFCGNAIEQLSNTPLECIAVTDTIPLPPEKMLPNMTILSVAPLIGEAIRRIHIHESLSKLFKEMAIWSTA